MYIFTDSLLFVVVVVVAVFVFFAIGRAPVVAKTNGFLR